MSGIINESELNSLKDNIIKASREAKQEYEKSRTSGIRTEVEVEARFTVNVQTFERLKTAIELEFKTQPKEIHSVVYFDEDTKRRVSSYPETTTNIHGVSVTKEKIKTIEKKSIWHTRKEDNTITDYGIKLDVSVEKFISEEPKSGSMSPRGKKSNQRIKSRSTYNVDNDAINIDLTYVRQSTIVNTRETPVEKYEVEIEINSRSVLDWINGYRPNRKIVTMVEALNLLNLRLTQIKKMAQNTIIIYKDIQKNNLSEHINAVLSGGEYKYKYKNMGSVNMDMRFVAKARNVKRQDFVVNGLIGKYQYTATLKAKGLRKLLVFYEDQLWMIYPPFDYCLVTRNIAFKKLHGTILDGEELKPGHGLKEHIKIQHYYSPFDTLADMGDRKIQAERLTIRQSIIEKVRNILGGEYKIADIFALAPTKKFVSLGGTIDDASNVIDSLYKTRNSVEFEVDGMMLTPDYAPYNIIDHEYNPFGIKLDRSIKRSITIYPETLKWKPWEEITIDFQVKLSVMGNKLLTVERKSDDKKEFKEFKGTTYNPFNSETQVIWDHPLLSNTGNIVEFGPVNKNGIIVLEPKLIRTDKRFPNEDRVAEDNWNDINQPVTYETLTGKTFDILRLSNNQIKRELISKILPGSDLVDIGSGYGGDIDKWSNLNKVLAIEKLVPNAEEFKNRLSKKSDDVKNKVELLVCGGEDYGIILPVAIKHFGWDKRRNDLPPLYISMMLSLSFFWKSYDMLANLSRTIKNIIKTYHEAGGIHPVKFVYYTIEGERTLEFFKLYGFGKEIKLGPAKMSFHTKPTDLKGEGEVHIKIDKTIVKSEEGEDQVEYLVKLKQLWEFTGLRETEPPSTAIHPNYLLTENEKIFAGLYVYGISEETGLTVTTPKKVEQVVIPVSKPESKPITPPFINVNLPNTRILVTIEKKVPIPPQYSLLYEYTAAFGDDDYKEWKWNGILLYRIGTLVENGSIFHCILKATYPEYQNNPSWFNRSKLVINLKRSTAYTLINNINIYNEITKLLGKVFKDGDDFIKWLATSDTRTVTPDSLQWLPTLLGVNIIFLSANGNKNIIEQKLNKFYIIVHYCIDSTYELVAYATPDGLLQTVFTVTHEIISYLLTS